jgi:hypothetical protein
LAQVAAHRLHVHLLRVQNVLQVETHNKFIINILKENENDTD